MGWVFNAVATLVGIVGVAIALLAYFKPPKRRKLAYQSASVRYFEEDDYALPHEAVMTFKGEKVARLSKTTVVLWNAGSEVLHGNDIVRADPIRLSLGEAGRILSYAVVGTSTPTNWIEVQARGTRELTLSYDYLDPKDGFVLDVMHDSKRRQLPIIGAAKGVVLGSRHRGAQSMVILAVIGRMRALLPRAERTFFRLLAGVGVTVATVGVALLLLGTVESAPPIWFSSSLVGDFLDQEAAVLALVFGAIYAAPSIWALWGMRRRYPKSLAQYFEREGRR